MNGPLFNSTFFILLCDLCALCGDLFSMRKKMAAARGLVAQPPGNGPV